MNGAAVLTGLWCALAMAPWARPSRLHAGVGSGSRTRSTPASRRQRQAVGAVVLAASALAAMGSPIGGTSTVLVLVAGTLLVSTARARRRRNVVVRHTERVVVRLCAELAAELAAGLAPGTALRRVAASDATTGQLVRRVALVEELGGDVPSAWRAEATAPGADGLRALAACWEVSHRTGSGLAALLSGVGKSLEERLRRRRDVEVRMAGAQSTVRLLSALPLAGLALGWALGANPLGPLLGTWWGRGCLVGAGVLDAAGTCWARSISRQAVGR